jgi:hypothetical protein
MTSTPEASDALTSELAPVIFVVSLMFISLLSQIVSVIVSV